MACIYGGQDPADNRPGSRPQNSSVPGRSSRSVHSKRGKTRVFAPPAPGARAVLTKTRVTPDR